MACRAGRMKKRRENPPFLHFFAFIFVSHIDILILVWYNPIKGGVKHGRKKENPYFNRGKAAV